MDDVELTLDAIRITGVKGWKKLFSILVERWLPHVYKTQLGNLASGISGVRSLLNIGSGMADLILLPLDEYKRDGRVVRGIQKGAKSFLKTAAIETLRFGSRLADGTQIVLEKAEGLFEDTTASTSSSQQDRGTVIAVPMDYQSQDSKTIKAIPVAILKPLLGTVRRAGQVMNQAHKDLKDPKSFK